MRLLLLAGVTGLAIAAALLGIGLHQADSASAPVTETEQRAALGPEGMTVNKHRARTPSAHQDGNRAAAVYLNQNVIDGVTTTVCAADPAMHDALSRRG